jgi:phage tail sheath protein FI
MPFQISPGVNVTEIDLTTIVPAVSTTEGAIAGVFRWGPAEYRELVSSETELVTRYAKPDANNYETFFTAANFLAYGNKLYVSRAVAANSFNAYTGANSSVAVANTQFKNIDDYTNQSGSYSANAIYVAKYPGAIGNSLKVSVCDSANAYSQSILTVNTDCTATLSFSQNSNTATLLVTSVTANTSANTTANTMLNSLNVGDYVLAGNSTLGNQYLKITSIGAPASNGTFANSTVFGAGAYVSFAATYNLAANVSVSSNSSVSGITRYWEFFNYVNVAPGTSDFVAALGGTSDEMHVVVVDEDGKFTGTPNQVLEVFPSLSRATDALGTQGGSIYYANFLANGSKYIYWTGHRSGYNVTTSSAIAAINTAPYVQSFRGGNDGVTENTIALGALTTAYDLFRNSEDIDISLVLTGKNRHGVYGEQLANYLIDNIAEYRKDCVVFITPKLENSVNNPGNQLNDTITFRRQIHGSSYAIIDSGYKYQYDKYNDLYRWVPMNGDIAGTVVRTDDTRDPWFSPAGFARGQIKNIVKLSFNPDKANRDQLYKNDINPVVNFPGQGVILYGDKTALGKPSAFDRINVRRLFIVLEKAIAIAAKASLFELNDEFTRAQFRNLVEPYLRDVKGRRGIYDFRVVCDGSNNTPERIDRNEFWGDIYIKPARSINFIQLNFVAVRTGVEFDEIVGKF